MGKGLERRIAKTLCLSSCSKQKRSLSLLVCFVVMALPSSCPNVPRSYRSQVAASGEAFGEVSHEGLLVSLRGAYGLLGVVQEQKSIGSARVLYGLVIVGPCLVAGGRQTHVKG